MKPLCESNLCIFVLTIKSGLRVKLFDGKKYFNPRSPNPAVFSATDRSNAVVPVLFLFCVALWFILRDASFFKSKSKMNSFKSIENIHKNENGSYYVVSANKASSVTL